MIKGLPEIHGPSHTFVAAIPLGLLGALFGKFFVYHFIPVLNRATNARQDCAYYFSRQVSWGVSIFSGLLGSISHVVVDAFMHHDMSPFSPESHLNPFLGKLTVGSLHGLLAGLLVGGGIIFIFMLVFRSFKK